MRLIQEGDFDVACPLCKAPPLENCRSTGGHGAILNAVHRERRQAAEEARRGV